MAKVKVRERKTGEVRLVPAHWLKHPILGAPFEAVPDPDAPAAGKSDTDEADAAAQAVSNADQTQRRGRRGQEG